MKLESKITDIDTGYNNKRSDKMVIKKDEITCPYCKNEIKAKDINDETEKILRQKCKEKGFDFLGITKINSDTLTGDEFFYCPECQNKFFVGE